MATTLPPGKVIIHATNDARDLNKNYQNRIIPSSGSRLVLRQMIDAVKDLRGAQGEEVTEGRSCRITQVREGWLKEWMPKLASR